MEFCISDLCIEEAEEATATKLHFERSNFRITFVERWPRKICGWKNDSVNRCAVYSITTRNSHTLLFVFTSSSSHPDRCQKTLVFFFKKPHIFPIRKDRFAALSYSSLQEEDSKKKKVKMVLVVVAKMVPKMNRWGESYWHFFSLLLTTNSQKDRLLVHSQLFFINTLRKWASAYLKYVQWGRRTLSKSVFLLSWTFA